MKKLLAFLVACLMPICLLAGSGDVNGDGKVNVADIVELLNHLNGNPTKNFNASEADANNDGVIDKNDVVAIADIVYARNIMGKVSLSKDFDDSFLQSCKLIGVSSECSIQNKTFQIHTNQNGLIQNFFISDKNKTYLAYRFDQSKEDVLLTIDVESSAIALATLHPLFAPINGSDYDDLVLRIKSSPCYYPYYQEVENAIKANKDLFDDSNEALIYSLEELYNDVLSKIDLNAFLNASAISLSRGTTRAPYESPFINPRYFYADITGNTLSLQCRGLTPSYYGIVRSGKTGEVKDFAVTSRSDYGGMDIFKPYDQMNLGDKCKFVFTTEGEYQFSLSRTNTAATFDFYMRLANSILNIIGLNFGDKTVINEIASTISNALLDAGMNIGMTATGVENSKFMDWFGIAYEATIDYLKRDTNILVKRGLIGNLQTYAMILNGAWNAYGKIKGAVNVTARLAYAALAPESLNFCLCYYHGSIYDCVDDFFDVSLEKISGDGQEGKENKMLENPLKVYVQAIDENGYYHNLSHFLKVVFKVEQGGGSVLYESVIPDKDGTAETYWKLGSEGSQVVSAVVWDFFNDRAVSNSVQFNASLLEKNYCILSECPDDKHPHWICLGLPSGTLWQCCNEGGSNPEDNGGYYDYKYNHVNNTSKILATGAVERAPTREQFEELIKYTTSEWTTLNGVYGRKFTGRNGENIFLPATRSFDTHNYGKYWTSSCASFGEIGAWSFEFSRDLVKNPSYGDLGDYYSIRPVRKFKNRLVDVEIVEIPIFEVHDACWVSQPLLVKSIYDIDTKYLADYGIYIKVGRGEIKHFSHTEYVVQRSASNYHPSIGAVTQITQRLAMDFFTLGNEYPYYYQIEGFYYNVDKQKLMPSGNYCIIGAYSKDSKTGEYEYHDEKILDIGYKLNLKYCPDNNHPHLIDLGLPNGTKWRCCNEGASSPEEAGGLYKFGQVKGAPSFNQVNELITSNNYWNWTTTLNSEMKGIRGLTVVGKNGNAIFIPDEDKKYERINGYWTSSTVWGFNDKDEHIDVPQFWWIYPYSFGGIYIAADKYKINELRSVRTVAK